MRRGSKTYEYGYLYLDNGKVAVGRPADNPSISAVIKDTSVTPALMELASHGWKRDDDSSILLVGKTQVRILRRVLEAPNDTTAYRVAVCPIDGEGSLQERIDRIQRLWEASGWDLLQVWEKGGLDYGPTMFFKKPRSAPASPFIDLE